MSTSPIEIIARPLWQFWLERASGGLTLFVRRDGAAEHAGYPITAEQLRQLAAEAAEPGA